MCGDSHTSTHGALGAYAFGIGASEVAHVLMTQTIWQSRPRRMRIRIDGALAPGCRRKDMALAIIAAPRHRTCAGLRHRICRQRRAATLSVEGRLTLCNMSIESGSRLGLVAPDETTFAYVRGRPYAPRARPSRRAVAAMARARRATRTPPSTREVELDGAEIAPIVYLGHDARTCGADHRARARSRECQTNRRRRRR